VSPEVETVFTELGAKARAAGVVHDPVLGSLHDRDLGKLWFAEIYALVTDAAEMTTFLREVVIMTPAGAALADVEV